MSDSEFKKYRGDEIEEAYKYKFKFIEWWRFRQAIKFGIGIADISKNDGSDVSDLEKYMFTTLGRSNYVIYTSLAASHEAIFSFNSLLGSGDKSGETKLRLQKHLTEIYFQFGRSFDAMLRILCILFKQQKLTIEDYQKYNFSKFANDQKQGNYPKLILNQSTNQWQQIRNLRNHFTHYQMHLYGYDPAAKEYLIPLLARDHVEGVFWWRAPGKWQMIKIDNNALVELDMERIERIDVTKMIKNDFDFMLNYFSNLYKQCTSRFPDWMTDNNLKFT